MTEQSVHLTSLRERIEEKVKRHLTKMYSNERAELAFEQDFHGDTVNLIMVKSYRVDEISHFKMLFRNKESGRYDGFNHKRDLTWTINAILDDLGL